MTRFVRVNKFCQDTGYTDKAVRHKIANGVWVEGREYRRAPDGHIIVDCEGYNRWILGQRQPQAQAA